MVVAALIVSIVALVVSALCALAVMELLASRSHGRTEVDDSLIEEFEVPASVAGTAASSHGLPERIDHLDRHLALFLSPMCAHCAAIASSLGGMVPDDLTVVVTASAPERMRVWSRDRGLSTDDVVFDDDMSIVGSLKVASSPTVVGFGAGRVVFAAGIGGKAALEKLLEQCSSGFSEDISDLLGPTSGQEPGGSPG
ncbi:MAG: hypothetical protein OXI56_05870 [bacterium]|nr:hypothetical protein [bacterium]MDE0601305.1 hypothetical protein [bacterium]